MEIFINNENLNYTIEQEHTIGEILGSLEAECEKSSMTITAIKIDGQNIPAEQLDAFFTRAPDSVAKIELETTSGNTIISQLRNLGKDLISCVPRLQEIPVQLQTGKDLDVLETIKDFSSFLQTLYQIIPLLSITDVVSEDISIDGIPLPAYPAEMSPFLTDLFEALKNKDTVTVGDISEYEIAPRIECLGNVLAGI